MGYLVVLNQTTFLPPVDRYSDGRGGPITDPIIKTEKEEVCTQDEAGILSRIFGKNADGQKRGR